MNKLSPQPSSLVLAEGQPIITGSYQAPTIDVYNPNQLTQSAEQIMSETNGGYYS